jgi:hypothetical protein
MVAIRSAQLCLRDVVVHVIWEASIYLGSIPESHQVLHNLKGSLELSVSASDGRVCMTALLTYYWRKFRNPSKETLETRDPVYCSELTCVHSRLFHNKQVPALSALSRRHPRHQQ